MSSLRLLSLGMFGFALAVLPVASGQAQQPVPMDTGKTESALVDSLRAALDRFESGAPPIAADSADLRRWTDSVRASGDALQDRRPERARELFKQVLQGRRALSDSVKIADAIGEIGEAYQGQAEYEEALGQYRKALSIFREIGDDDGSVVILINLGTVHLKQSRYEKALARYREARQISREIDDQFYITVALTNIGIVHENQGQYEEALAYYRKALQIDRELKNQRGIAIGLNSIGVVYKNQGQHEKALAHYRESLQIQRKIGFQRGIAVALENIGNVRAKQGQYEEALARHQKSLRIRRESGNREAVARSLNNIGHVYGKQGRREEALSRYQKALQLHREIGDRIGVIVNLDNIGETLLGTGRLRAATDTLRQVVQLVEELRPSTTSPEARRSLLATQIDAYQKLTTAYVRSGRPARTFRSLERARARLLADRLAGTARGDTTFSIPTVAELQQTLGPEEAAVLYANTNSEWPLTVLTVTRDSIHAREVPDSTLRAWVAEADSTQLNHLHRQEGRLTVARGGTQTSTDGTMPSLAETIRLYHDHLAGHQTERSVRMELARRFHQLLIEPVAEHIQSKEELVIVPTGALGYLPFETLRDSTGQYLIERKHIRYAQSLTILQQLQQREYAERERPLLALGGAAYESSSAMDGSTLVAEARRGSIRVATDEHANSLLQAAETRLEQGKSPRPTYQKLGYSWWSNLPETQKEATRLGKITGSSSTVITGQGASEDTVRSLNKNGRLNDYRRLHFATHGIAVPETPDLSALVLSQVDASDSLAARDGYLTMEEIASLEMKADVAVLSACQTGLGKVVAGEGMVSLSHAFLRAGANATLVSQWKVLDESTRTFMTAVYERAQAEDMSFAEAVTKTKRAFIDGESGEKGTDPLRWAPFVYYGRE